MMISQNRILDSQEMPRRDSIHRSLYVNRRFSRRFLTPMLRSSHRPRIKTSVERQREPKSESAVRFVDPKALPERESPKRYGSKRG